MNKIKENERLKLYRENNPNIRKETQKKYYLANKAKLNLKTNEYRKLNQDKVNKKANDTAKIKKETNPVYKLKCGLRRNISMLLKRGSYNKTSTTEEILGCSYEEFKIYLESQFQDWMTWNNYGKYNGELDYGWDIDHIEPLSKAKNEADIIRLNHYTNLQPLCSYTNRYIKKDN